MYYKPVPLPSIPLLPLNKDLLSPNAELCKPTGKERLFHAVQPFPLDLV